MPINSCRYYLPISKNVVNVASNNISYTNIQFAFLLIAITEVINSGSEVPIATITTPITNSDNT